jgi:serine phosphatase RsbU (regulator of sigma subunit)
MPSLILIKGPAGGPTAGRKYALAGDVMTIGREENCEIVVPNHAVSRKHAQISRVNGQFYVQDLNSRNHTYINNKEVVTPTPLRNDDRIKICDFQFLFQDERSAPGGQLPLPPDFSPAAEEQEPGGPEHFEHTFSARSATELLEAQPSERIKALLDISVGLSRMLELDPLLNTISDTLFGVFRQADRCFVIFTDDAGRLLPKVVKARRSVPGDDQRFSKTIIRRCLETAQAYLSEDAAGDPGLQAVSIIEFRIRSVMCVPLIVDGKAIGALQLDTQDRGKKFREDDLKLLTIVANLCAVAIERARMHEAQIAQKKQENEIKIAQEVQKGFLPQSAPKLPGYEFFSFYGAAQTVGGDYYDFIPLPDGRLGVLLGDVAGKGVPASLLMARLSAEARFCMLTQPDLPRAVNLLNEQLIRGGIGDRFVTLAAAVLDPATHRVTLVNAGHMNPLRLRLGDGELTDAVSNADSGLPLGVMSGFENTAVELTLGPGENLIFFTDGVTDAMSPTGALFGPDGLRAALADDPKAGPPTRPQEIGERLIAAVRRHAAGKPQNDDIAVVCFGRLDPSVGPPTGGDRPARA